MKLRALIGSGDRIAGLTLPFLVVGLPLNALYPSVFTVGGPPGWLRILSLLVLIAGVAVWMWSVALIVTRVPRRELITDGPYAVVKHPLYTAVALLVVPWIGFLLDSWLGALIGAVLYVGSRLFSPLEERALAKAFGPAWDEYCKQVKLPWL
jgi:protein-S-isoprenylcysteine O-methyltransferase Ste14